MDNGIKGTRVNRSSNTDELGNLIKTLRGRKGLTLRALAEKTNISFPTLWRIEEGKPTRMLHPDKLKKLARALDCAYEDITAAAGFKGAEKLPSLTIYLRQKYDVDEADAEKIGEYLDVLTKSHKGENENESSGFRITKGQSAARTERERS